MDEDGDKANGPLPKRPQDDGRRADRDSSTIYMPTMNEDDKAFLRQLLEMDNHHPPVFDLYDGGLYFVTLTSADVTLHVETMTDSHGLSSSSSKDVSTSLFLYVPPELAPQEIESSAIVAREVPVEQFQGVHDPLRSKPRKHGCSYKSRLANRNRTEMTGCGTGQGEMDENEFKFRVTLQLRRASKSPGAGGGGGCQWGHPTRCAVG